jgi:Domain of unknown function DUF29
MPTSDRYKSDFYAWTQEQAKLLREQRWEGVDWTNVIEEIESLGRQERRELEDRFAILLGHLLKWQFQPDGRGKSWRSTIREQRRQIRKQIQKNPSLQAYTPEAMEEGYEGGLDLAVRETSLDYEDFPATCPYTFEQALADDFFPN